MSSTAGPSRPPPFTPSTGMNPSGTIPAARRSPGRSFSLSIKSKGKLPIRTGLHDRRWELDFGKGNRSAAAIATRVPTTHEEMDREPPTATSATDSSLRRTVSSEDTRSLASSCTSPPPHPPPKDPIPRRPPDARYGLLAESPTLLQTVRMKMSTDDQEAMRKLRLTMDMSESTGTGTGTGSSGGSPLSPNFGGASSSSHSHSRPTIGSRRSTLSRQMISEDLDDEPRPPPAPQEVSTLSPDSILRSLWLIMSGATPIECRLCNRCNRTQGRREVNCYSTSYKSLGRLESSRYNH